MKKRLLALVLALVMILSVMPVAVAENEVVAEPVEETPVEEQVVEQPVEEEEVPETVGEAPAEEPEEPEPVGSDTDYQVKLVFKYGESGQADKELILQNGILSAAQEETIAPQTWEGHKFIKWDYPDEKGTKLGELNKITFPDAGKIEINAIFEPETFKVLFRAPTPEAAGANTPADIDAVEYGKTLTAAQVAVTGNNAAYDYEKAIYKVGDETIDIKTYAIKAETIISIEIPLKKVAVKFYLDAEKKNLYETQTIDIGTKATKPADPTTEHATFKTWDGIDFDAAIEADTDVIATWTPDKIDVTFDPNGGKVDGEATKVVSVDYNTPVGTSPVADKDGAVFYSWQLNGEDFDVVNTKITEAITLVANYETEQVTLTYVSAVEGEKWPTNEPPHTQKGDWGTAFTAYDGVTLEGYTLDGWTDGTMKDGKPVKFNFSAVKADATLQPIWKANPITITLVAGQADAKSYAVKDKDGKAVPFKATIEAKYNDAVVLANAVPEKPADNTIYIYKLADIHDFDFVEWYYIGKDKYGDPVEIVYAGTENLTEDITLYARWDAYYTVTLYDGVDKDKKDVPYKTEAPFNAKGEVKVYVEDKAVEGRVTVKSFKELAAGFYADLDAEPMEDGAKYFVGFFNGDAEVDLAKDAVASDLTLKAKRLDVVKVTFTRGCDDETLPEKAEVIYPKGKTLAEAKDLRGGLERFPVPAWTRVKYEFMGWLKAGTIFADTTPINEDTELKADWEGITWTVTIDLDGATFSGKTEYKNIIDGDPIEIEAIPAKTDLLFVGWLYQQLDEEGNPVKDKDGKVIEPKEFVPVNFGGPEATKITADTKLTIEWKSFAAKDKTAKGDPKKEAGKYFETLGAALASEAKDIIVLDNITAEGEDANLGVLPEIIPETMKTVEMSGKTITLGAGDTIFGNSTVIFKNGTVKGGIFTDVVIASGTYEDVALAYAGEVKGAIKGGNFKWTDKEEVVKETVDNINDSGWVVEGKKLHLKNGYYTPVAYKTLVILAGKNFVPAWGVVDVFDGEKTELPKAIADEIKAEKDKKFDKWLIEDDKAEEPAEFTFGSELTEDTTIYATWIEKVTVHFDGWNYSWDVETYSDQVIEAPVEPTEDEYAEMTNSKEQQIREMWEALNGEGFLGWRYGYYEIYDEDEGWIEGPLSGKNVKFGVDKAQNITIYAAFKNAITFCGLDGEVIEILWLDDGETVGDRLPEAPAIEGYTFMRWTDGDWEDASIFDTYKKIYENHWVYATYSSGNWAISGVDTWLSDGFSSLPTDELIFGGDKELNLRAVDEDDEWYIDEMGLSAGKYYLAFEVEAPDGIGDQNREVNEVEWVYRTDDEAWESFNGKGRTKGADYVNASQHLVMHMYKEVTWDMLKKLVDEKAVKTWTITLAPADKKDDKSAYVTLKVTLDPKNVYLYADYGVEPVHAIIKSNYKFTVTFDMDGGAAVKPVTVEYGTSFNMLMDEAKFEDSKLDWKDPEIARKIKKYCTFIYFGYYENEGDEELSQIEWANFIVRKDQTVYALYWPFTLGVDFFDAEGNYLNTYWGNGANNPEDWVDRFGLSSPLSALEVPEGVAAQFGTNDWHPVMVDGEDKPIKDTIAKEAYDMSSDEIIGDKYYNEKEPAKSYVRYEDGEYRLALIKGDEVGYTVTFYGGWQWYWNGEPQWTPGKDDPNWDWDDIDDDDPQPYMVLENPISAEYYTADENGNVMYGEIEIPEIKDEYSQVNGWRLIPAGYQDDPEDIKLFDFEKNASKTFKEDQNFLLSSTGLGGGDATLYSANVEFDGLIHLIFKYNFQHYDSRADHYVVFRVGDEELARVTINDEFREKNLVEGSGNWDDNANRYAVTCPVPIVNYTEAINVSVEDSKGDEWWTVTGKGVEVEGGYDYSLETYAKNKASSTNPKMAALAKALQDYGIAARLFAGKTDVKEADLSDAVKNLKVEDMKVSETVVTDKDDRPEGITASQTVIFESDNTLQVTFKGCDTSCTFEQDGKAVDIAPDADGNVVLKVANIAPDKLDTAHTFKCTKDGKSFEVTTSVLGYAKRTAEKGSDAMKNLAKALYIYAQAAIDYAK